MKRLIAVALALGGGTACESCDWGFGPIPMTVHVTPEDVDATVVICDDEGDATDCRTLSTASDTGATTFGAPPAPGTVQTTVGWDGYAVCKYPGLEVDVTAPGCDPVHRTVDRHRPDDDEDGIHLDVSLRCD